MKNNIMRELLCFYNMKKNNKEIKQINKVHKKRKRNRKKETRKNKFKNKVIHKNKIVFKILYKMIIIFKNKLSNKKYRKLQSLIVNNLKNRFQRTKKIQKIINKGKKFSNKLNNNRFSRNYNK